MEMIQITYKNHHDSLSLLHMLWVYECSFEYDAKEAVIKAHTSNLTGLRSAIDMKDIQGDIYFVQDGIRYDTYLEEIKDASQE